MVCLSGLWEGCQVSESFVCQACGKVVKYLSGQVDTIRFCLDGKNVDAVLMEIGMRFHRVVYDHLLQFQYNSMGMCCSLILPSTFRHKGILYMHENI